MERTTDPTVAAARVIARLARVVEQECLRQGLGLSQYRLLLFAAREPQRAGALASRAVLTRPAATAAVDALVARGLLERREVDGDRRGVHLAVTRAGRAALAQAERRLADRLAGLLGPAEQLAGTLRGLPAVERAVDEEIEREISARSSPTRRARVRRSGGPSCPICSTRNAKASRGSRSTGRRSATP